MDNQLNLSAHVNSSPDIPVAASVTAQKTRQKKDADYVFLELTRSICPECRRIIDAHILLRNNKVYMRKRCPEHGTFEGLVYGDAQAYVSATRFNKPGTIPLTYSTDIEQGCPHDCGLCPDHQQHTCLGIFARNIFMVMLQDFMDPWTFNQKNLMKCCKEILLPDGKQIPFCAYNNVGYREQARTQLQARERQRIQAKRAGVPFVSEPLHFSFTSVPKNSPSQVTVAAKGPAYEQQA